MSRLCRVAITFWDGSNGNPVLSGETLDFA